MVGLESGAAWEPGGEWLVVEADESDGTFLELGAEAVVVTSVEADHLDFYGDEAALRAGVRAFAAAAAGPRVCCADDPAAPGRWPVGPSGRVGTASGGRRRSIDLRHQRGGGRPHRRP